MTPYDSSSPANMPMSTETEPSTQPSVDVTPPIGVTPPQVLAQDAAKGRRGAAWRLLYWVIENDPRAVVAIASLDDDRLAHHLLEFVAIGTWAGKPFVVPPPLRSAHARTRLRTLFLPGSGIDSIRAERVLMATISDKRPVVRETAAHILGIIGSRSATHELIEALRGADEQMGSQIFTSLVQLGHDAVPALVEASSSSSSWMRWHCIRALGEIGDIRALPVLVQALRDNDHSIAWMGAKGLVRFRKRSIVPVLRLLTSTDLTPWLVETASYVLTNQYEHNPKLKPYLEPVVHHMHGVAYQVATPHNAQKALAQLIADGLVQHY